MSPSDLTTKHCKPCEGGVDPLTRSEAEKLLGQLNGWTLNGPGTAISRAFRYRNFHEVMEFVNALAWVAHREDHHPDLEVGYSRVNVHYTTHAIGGLSENDFICAAKIDALLA
ncbi:MAG: 4a-hydroxytetrahydrobiopterin dehydratase [Gammaproteobacteria bacterium]|nr:4a-hydroxytetrahydrobiopterin dehydratase [Gammaproteobacteria bacterium]